MGRTSTSPNRLAFWLTACLALQAPPVFAQIDMTHHVMEMKDQLPPEELPEARRLTGIGNAQMEITAKPEAQVWFNQGLNLLHDFWDYESARAFEQGIRVDPQCAMCYWGLYKAESFYHSIAQGYAARALAHAVSLKDQVSPRERLYIEATAPAGELKSNASRATASQLWREIVKEYPNDLQARIFLSQSVNREESVAILQAILKTNPDDSAANHYYIHALESSDHPEHALHSAEILGSLAPASGHMVHMPGHIYFRMGDYARAEQSFTASMEVDERYMREQYVAPDDDWNYVHNLMYAIANLLEQGKLKAATAISAKLANARGKFDSTLYPTSARDSISRLSYTLPVALRTANWKEAARLLKAGKAQDRPNLDFLARQLTDFAVGMQAIDSRNLQEAEAALGRFEAGLKQTPPQASSTSNARTGAHPQLQVMPDALLRPLVSSLSVMAMEFRASLLIAQGQKDAGAALFAKAAQAEKDLGYREPPNYIRPVGETEGAALIAAGDWKGAKAAYQKALAERPRSGFALYGIALATEKAGDADSALKEYDDFLSAWKNADPGIPEVAHAQAYLAGAGH